MKYIPLLLFIFSAGMISAQETLFPLDHNPVLVKLDHSNHMRMAFVDTASLPFVEDFSLNSHYPTDSLWIDRHVFVNTNYSPNPVTIGVGTLDGLNEFGRPYQPGANFDSVADFLTSKPLRMSLAAGDTNAWLSFFYEPQGWGDQPESGDSLVLQFKDTGGVWNTMWSVPGRADTAMQRVNIRVSDPKFHFDGFQFRFYNIATVNGNRDHWHLDYIILDKNTVENVAIPDFAFIRPQTSLLTEYTAMPYSHYKVAGVPGAQMRPELEDTIRNFDYGPSAVAPFINISDQMGLNNTYSYPNTIVGLNLQNDTGYIIPLNGFQFPVYANDSMDFLVKSYSDSPLNQNKLNDSSHFYQHFHNYYAYDDGTAEVAYGLTGNTDVWAAYQFNLTMQDTLRGVQIYFNPTGINVTNVLFQLTVWSDVNVGANTSTELYRMINQRPDSFDGVNVFKTYVFDTLLVVGPGNIWVGMIQNQPLTLYGIGFDRNTDSRSKMFYHIDGFWYQSSIQGSWMIRPLFGKEISLVGVEELANTPPSFSLYPNPANDKLYLRTDEKGDVRFEIYSILGKIISSGTFTGSTATDVSSLARGMYVVKITDRDNNFSSGKFILE